MRITHAHAAIAVATLTAATIAACASDNAPTRPLSADRNATRAATASTALRITPDALNDSVAAREPSYGGFYFSRGHQLTIWTTDSTRGNSIHAEIARLAHLVGDPHANDIETTTITVRRADYTIADLARWRRNLEQTSHAWIMSDVDERANRITFAGATAADVQQVRAAAAALHIPDAALLTPLVTTKQTGTLYNVARSAGGSSIYNTSDNIVCSVMAVDSISGFAAGIVTAGHCDTHGTGTTFYNGWGAVVAEHYYKAGVFNGTSHGITCPAVFIGYCQWADVSQLSADAALYPNSESRWSLYTTTDSTEHYTGGTAGITLSAAPDTLVPWTETTSSSFHVGDIVHKVGVGTGHTYGPVSASCVNIQWPSGSGNYLACQTIADMFSDAGDSGGTVYSPNTGILLGRASLYGMVEGTISYGTDSTRTVFAGVDDIHYALNWNGAITLCWTCSTW